MMDGGKLDVVFIINLLSQVINLVAVRTGSVLKCVKITDSSPSCRVAKIL